ncbi:hypothetical protein ASPZODRAFT_134610 [Penicilliopsis zonata CBS 506.65]|uniref:Uncharacterized protein n=1 Tax=Penicilliopsis zonata CBS 506.65 TaxID=1073090 RepID=A0A1L9SBH0_9EURO|nr:hypothetical protein ASPZODRAFT_134610 [Penicilliopsis zonata CBS 506.65]OJJ44530.1 hypothetical protein ASPZODRAFT_134610 [Penicilliopsis zonata CBS 506.65]
MPVLPRFDVAHRNSTQTAQNSSNNGSSNNKDIIIITATVVIFVVSSSVMAFFLLRALRRMNCRPKYIPGKYLKEKWNQWSPGASYGRVAGGSAPNRDPEDTAYHGASAAGVRNTTATAEMNRVHRDTSIRSVMTLPAYTPSPKPTEQVIAREGERGGMDVVIEFPETADQEESRREGHMEALYQIRLQRRQEIAEREARRRERQEARARGDHARIDQMREEARARQSFGNSSRAAAAALADHQARARERRISSVSYAELGYVRHDGSRVRAASPDSDRSPLLQNPAAADDEHSHPASLHSRDESFTSSIVPLATMTPDGDSNSLTPVATEEEDDLGAQHIPPPQYDDLDWGDAPAYESPIAGRGEIPPLQLPIEHIPVPTIHIDIASPVNSQGPNTPLNPHQSEPEPATSATATSHPIPEP